MGATVLFVAGKGQALRGMRLARESIDLAVWTLSRKTAPAAELLVAVRNALTPSARLLVLGDAFILAVIEVAAEAAGFGRRRLEPGSHGISVLSLER